MPPLEINKEKLNAALAQKSGCGPLNYCEDLNALRLVEETLSLDQQYTYGEELAQVVRRPENLLAGDDPETPFPLNGWGLFSIANSSALARAQALLKILP